MRFEGSGMILEIRDIRKSFGPVEVLKGVSLSVDAAPLSPMNSLASTAGQTLLRWVKRTADDVGLGLPIALAIEIQHRVDPDRVLRGAGCWEPCWDCCSSRYSGTGWSC